MSSQALHTPRTTSSRFFRYALLVVVMVWAGLLVYVDKSLHASALATLTRQLQDQLVVRTGMIQDHIEANVLKVRFLFTTPPVSGIVRATANSEIDPLDGTRLQRWKERLQTIFVGFVENNPDIQQARYIGVADGGRELLRIERRFNKVEIALPSQLQAKGDRDYFQEIEKLHGGDIFVSDINLNRDFGKLEYPFRPTYRVGIPVLDAQQQFFGLIIINVNAVSLLTPLHQNLDPRFSLYLLNENTDFILHPDKQFNFAFEFGKQVTWDQMFRAPQTDANAAGELKTVMDIQRQDPLYYADTEVQLAGPEFGRHLRLVLGVSGHEIDRMVASQRNDVWLISGIVLALVIVLMASFRHYIGQQIDLSAALSEYEAIINGSSDAIIGMDRAGQVTSWNDSAQDIFGIAARVAVGKNAFKLLVSQAYSIELEEAVKKVLAGELVMPFRLSAVRRNGTVFPISVTLSPINRSGVQTGVAAIVRDISEQVEIEDKIANLNASLEQQVAERTQELETARNDALSASKAKSEFVANISHEIRTPLNGLAGMLNLLKRGDLGAQQLRYLKMAEGSTVTLSALINDILDVSKIEAGKLEIESIEFDLLQLASDMAVSMAIRAQEKGLEFVLDVTEISERYVVGDPHRIRQIITNLIGNAIKFTEQGEVVLSLKTELLPNRAVSVQGAVRDTGVGISEQGRQQLFEAFAQEDSSVTRRYGGTGLGLSICRQLCNLMHGQIAVVSEKGEGSTFSFGVRLMETKRSDRRVPSLDLEDRLILVADSNAAVRQTLASQLRGWKARVEAVDSGMALMQHLASTDRLQPAAILVDEALWQAMREHAMPDPVADGFPAVLVMGAGDSAIPSNGMHPAPQLIRLRKPVTPFELGTRLGKCLLGDASATAFELTDDVQGVDHSAFARYAGRRVLLVDDNEINLEVAAGLMADLGLVIVRAHDGQQALDIMSDPYQPIFGLVLMDCQMPVLDGYSATRAIRAGSAGHRNRYVPIIAMTANAMAGDRERCVECGMNDYLTKPVDPEALELKLLFWLSQAGHAELKFSAGSEDLENVSPSALAAEDHADSADAAKVWDRAALLKRVRNRPDRLEELVDVFLDLMPERLRQLGAAVMARQLTEIESLAHAIKGSAANLGGMQVQQHAGELEAASRAGDNASIDLAWQALELASDQLLEALRQRNQAA